MADEDNGFSMPSFDFSGELDQVDMFTQALQELQATPFEDETVGHANEPELIAVKPIIPEPVKKVKTTAFIEDIPEPIKVIPDDEDILQDNSKPVSEAITVKQTRIDSIQNSVLNPNGIQRVVSTSALNKLHVPAHTGIHRVSSTGSLPSMAQLDTYQEVTNKGQKVTIIRPSVVASGHSSRSPSPTISLLRPNTTLLTNMAQSVSRSGSPLLMNQKFVRNTNSPLSAPTISLDIDKMTGKPVYRVVRSSSPIPVNTVSQLPPSSNGLLQLTTQDVSRLWSNNDMKLTDLSRNNLTSAAQSAPVSEMEEEAEIEDEDLGHAETYANYMPSKSRIGIKHPDAVVETSSLGSVEPPDVYYNLEIPEDIIDAGCLSALQLEAIVYTCQRHNTFLANGQRAGFLIGDGAGVGKGREIAGIIYENYLQGRKRAIWLSVSNDLKVDAERDLRDIGAGKINVYSLNKFKYKKITHKENGSVKKGVIFSTYSSLIGESTSSDSKYRTRFKQLLHWCGEDFDGLIVFDECHKAKNLCPVGSSKPTKTGLTVQELQNKLPKARIVYASATGASEPRNMAYMVRLGLWGEGTPFIQFNDFIMAIERRGVGAMELVAMDMKLRGMYIARQLSFKGVTFRIEEVPIESKYIKMYNAACKMWADARAKFQVSADLIQAEKAMRKSMWGQFWGSHQRFFKYLCISAKVSHVVNLARDAIKNGKCVVIGLQSTGEARTLEQLEEQGGELNDFVSTAKGVFQTLVEKHFPAPNRKKTYGMFGVGKGGSLLDMLDGMDDNDSWDSSKSGIKRKKDQGITSVKKSKISEDSASSSDSESSSKSDDSAWESNDSDFNPFGAFGSDSDEDPWLQSTKKKKKNKQKKVKKAKKKKKKKDSVDNKFDKALEAAGLKPSKYSITDSNIGRDSPISKTFPEADDVQRAIAAKQELLDQLAEIADYFPPNTLDELVDRLGGSDNVAEMTGRKGRVVSDDDGLISYESRSVNDVPLEILNLTEKQRFMDGEKEIAIISEAASSGISLQADRRELNQKRRVHITLELPWSADRAVQQFGRTHRSNQVSAPEYVFLISELAGERRFAATVAKRLESLGALTHGDRRATESRDLSRFNVDNKYGRTALESVMKTVCSMEAPLVPTPQDYDGDFMKDVKHALVSVGMLIPDERIPGFVTLDKDYNNISKFLNRLLGIQVPLQNHLFQYFMNTLTAVILQAKQHGRWDMGILDLGSGGENVKVLNCRSFMGDTTSKSAKTELYTISVERGLSWDQALEKWREFTGKEDGFYITLDSKTNARKTAILAVATSGRKKERLYSVYKPNTGLQVKLESITDIKNKYKKVLPDECQQIWHAQFEASAYTCSHIYWRGSCKRITAGLSCEIGLRSRTYHILAGLVLGIWGKVESVLASVPGGHQSRMQIIRVQSQQGKKIVGTLIPANCLDALCNMLSQESNSASNMLKTLTSTQVSRTVNPEPQTNAYFHQLINGNSMQYFK